MDAGLFLCLICLIVPTLRVGMHPVTLRVTIAQMPVFR